MDFKAATDRIGALGVTHDEIAAALGVGTQSVRQARLAPGATSHRNAPGGWQAAVAKLARERAVDLVKLAEQLEPQLKKREG